MNDSFLEDLELIPKESYAQNNVKLNNRYITTRKVLSSPTNIISNNRYESSEVKQDKIISCSSLSKMKINRRSGSQEPRKLSGSEPKPLSSTPKSDKKNALDENIIKSTENHVKDEVKTKSHDVKPLTKFHEGKSSKDRRRSGSSGGSSRFLDASSKENTRPLTDSTSSRDSACQTEPKRDVNRISEVGSKKMDVLENSDPIIFLSAIKDLVSRYTEQETVKVLRATQNFYVNSQANLIKHLMCQTNELVKELGIQNRFDNMKNLVEENERLREDVFILQTRNEILQKQVNEILLIKEENISLKLKLKELEQ